MKIIKDLYNIIKQHRMVALVLVVVFIVAFYPKETPVKYTNYTKTQEQTTPVTSSNQNVRQFLNTMVAGSLTEGDYIYSQGTVEFFDKNPWYKKIPIDKQTYIVVYDFQRNSFRIALKISQASSEAQKNSAINAALKDIKNIGADPTKYYVIFIQ